MKRACALLLIVIISVGSVMTMGLPGEAAVATTTETSPSVKQPPWQRSTNSLAGRARYLLDSGDYSDVNVHVGNKTFKLHRTILVMSSSVFAAKLYPEHQVPPVNVTLSENIKPLTFQRLLKYIYKDEVELSSLGDSWELWSAAFAFKIDDLLQKTAKHINTSITVDNVLEVFEKAVENNETSLQATCMEIIQKSTSTILSQPYFLKLGEKNVKMIVGNTLLNATEAQIFQGVLQWANTSVSKENKTQISAALRHKLHDVLPLLNLDDMTPEEFVAIVQPTGILTPESSNLRLTSMLKKMMPTRKASKTRFTSHGNNKEDACGGAMDAPIGVIFSPSFPATYPGNKNCIWEITVETPYVITLTFTHFDLESNNVDFQPACMYDRVTVYSKLSTNETRNHGVFCGSHLPPPITSEGNALKIEFASDDTLEKTGFSAIYSIDIDECSGDNGGCEHECLNTLGSFKCSCNNGFVLAENGRSCKAADTCKYEITYPLGEFSSPNYPNEFPKNRDCEWHFTTTPGHRIKVVFDKFDMEHAQDCVYDHVTIYDGGSPDSQTLGTFCGSKVPDPIISSRNEMYMVFKSDEELKKAGFHGMHSTVCGGTLQATSEAKYLYSHAMFGEQMYDNNQQCEWIIDAASGETVNLTFLTFELGYGGIKCDFDHVEVFEGSDDSAPSFRRFCSGWQIPSETLSLNGPFMIRFRSNGFVGGKGFSAMYKTAS